MVVRTAAARRMVTRRLVARWITCGLAATVLWAGGDAIAQSLETRLDEDRYLRGLTELQLPEVLEQYIADNADAPPERQAVYEIARQRLVLRRPGLPPVDRRAAIEAMLAIRAALIDAHPGHPDRATWRADQGADLLFELLSLDGSATTLLTGVPSRMQIAELARVADDLERHMSIAEVEVERAVRMLRSGDDAESFAALTRRRRLVEEERDRRIPFLRGIGAYLQAALLELEAGSNAADRAELYGLAADALEPLIDDLDGVVGARVRLYCGLALAGLGEMDAAALLLAAVDADAEAHVSDRFIARLSPIVLRRRSGQFAGARALLEAMRDAGDWPEDTFFQLLLDDQAFLISRDESRAAPAGQRVAALGDAYAVWITALEETLSAVAEREAIILARMTAAIEPEAPLTDLPPLVSVARADRLGRDPETRQEAIVLYRSILERRRLTEGIEAMVLVRLGQSLRDEGMVAEAIDVLLRLVAGHQAHPSAPAAAETAAALALRAHRESPDAAARERVLHSLAVLDQRFPTLPTINRWRLAGGQFALAEHRYDDAIERFESISTNNESRLRGRYLAAVAHRGAARSIAGQPGEAGRWADAIAAFDGVQAELQAAADRATGAAKDELIAWHIHIDVFRAEAEVAVGRPQIALGRLAGLETRQIIPMHVLADLLRTRIAAHGALGNVAAAHDQLREFLRAAPVQVSGVLRPMLDVVEADVTSSLAVGDEAEARDIAERELVPLLEILVEWMDGTTIGPAEREALSLRVANGLRLAGRYAEALPRYDELLADRPASLSYVLGRAECLFGLGGDHLGAAMLLYRRIANMGVDAGGDAWWQATVRSLQVLDIVNRNTDRIGPRIQQLRQLDPELGGERWRRALEALEQTRDEVLFDGSAIRLNTPIPVLASSTNLAVSFNDGFVSAPRPNKKQDKK